MPARDKMKCPKCGAEMNCHAEKLDYTAALSEPGFMDPQMGAVVQEVHACPACGTAALRRAQS